MTAYPFPAHPAADDLRVLADDIETNGLSYLRTARQAPRFLADAGVAADVGPREEAGRHGDRSLRAHREGLRDHHERVLPRRHADPIPAVGRRLGPRTVRPLRSRTSTSADTGRGGHGLPATSTGHVGPAVTLPTTPDTVTDVVVRPEPPLSTRTGLLHPAATIPHTTNPNIDVERRRRRVMDPISARGHEGPLRSGRPAVRENRARFVLASRFRRLTVSDGGDRQLRDRGLHAGPEYAALCNADIANAQVKGRYAGPGIVLMSPWRRRRCAERGRPSSFRGP